MAMIDMLQVLLYAATLIVLAPPLGRFLANVFEGRKTFLHRPFGWVERVIYKSAGVNPQQEMHWKQYTGAVIWFNLFGFLIVFVLQLVQAWLPLNPQHVANTSCHLAFNTAVSFVTNTNWQSYAGESTPPECFR